MFIGVDGNEANIKNRLGSNQYAYNVLKQLNKLDKQNQYLIYLKHHPVKDLPEPSQNWQYQVVKSVPFWTQWRLPIALFLSKPKPDLFLSLGHYAPFIASMPTIVTVLDLAYLFYPKTYLKKDLFKLKHWTKKSVNKASHIITISKSTKKDIQKHYQVSKEKITVAYPGIDYKQFSQKRTSSLPYQDYLLYLGTLQPRKNLENLVLAYSQLPIKLKKYPLVIAGKKGWLYQSLFKQAKKLNLEKEVIFTGFINQKNLPSLIQHAKLFILPSFYEGFGIPVINAMASKTPVLVSKNSSLKEIVKSHGSYIKPPFLSSQIKQGIMKALASKPSLELAQNHAKQFSWQKTAKIIMEVINEFAI